MYLGTWKTLKTLLFSAFPGGKFRKKWNYNHGICIGENFKNILLPISLIKPYLDLRKGCTMCGVER